MAGMNRSATIVAAYLMKYHKMTLMDTIWHMSLRRPWILSNPGFKKQLIVYAYENDCLGDWKGYYQRRRRRKQLVQEKTSLKSKL